MFMKADTNVTESGLVMTWRLIKKLKRRRGHYRYSPRPNEHLLSTSESGSLRSMALRQACCQDDSGDGPTTLYGALDALYTG